MNTPTIPPFTETVKSLADAYWQADDIIIVCSAPDTLAQAANALHPVCRAIVLAHLESGDYEAAHYCLSLYSNYTTSNMRAK